MAVRFVEFDRIDGVRAELGAPSSTLDPLADFEETEPPDPGASDLMG